jgi:hypothetical protein
MKTQGVNGGTRAPNDVERRESRQSATTIGRQPQSGAMPLSVASSPKRFPQARDEPASNKGGRLRVLTVGQRDRRHDRDDDDRLLPGTSAVTPTSVCRARASTPESSATRQRRMRLLGLARRTGPNLGVDNVKDDNY